MTTPSRLHMNNSVTPQKLTPWTMNEGNLVQVHHAARRKSRTGKGQNFPPSHRPICSRHCQHTLWDKFKVLRSLLVAHSLRGGPLTSLLALVLGRLIRNCSPLLSSFAACARGILTRFSLSLSLSLSLTHTHTHTHSLYRPWEIEDISPVLDPKIHGASIERTNRSDN